MDKFLQKLAEHTVTHSITESGKEYIKSSKRYAEGKNPVIAFILSLIIVGSGQFYNGDIKKGSVFLVCAIALGCLFYGVLWIVLAIWSSIDAVLVASKVIPVWEEE